MPFEKIEKENLTNDLIKQDILNNYINDSHITINIILVFVSILFALLFSFLSPFALFFLFIPLSLFIFSYVKRKEKIKEVEKGEFFVVIDELLYEKQGELRTEATFYKGRWISYLQFYNHGRWELEGTYYSWSNKYKMSSTGICNTSLSKDTFYVVCHKNKQEIVMAYNTKFFDYKP